jgi:hypothetical protein
MISWYSPFDRFRSCLQQSVTNSALGQTAHLILRVYLKLYHFN